MPVNLRDRRRQKRSLCSFHCWLVHDGSRGFVAHRCTCDVPPACSPGDRSSGSCPWCCCTRGHTPRSSCRTRPHLQISRRREQHSQTKTKEKRHHGALWYHHAFNFFFLINGDFKTNPLPPSMFYMLVGCRTCFQQSLAACSVLSPSGKDRVKPSLFRFPLLVRWPDESQWKCVQRWRCHKSERGLASFSRNV